jgi:hypothetical protein
VSAGGDGARAGGDRPRRASFAAAVMIVGLGGLLGPGAVACAAKLPELTDEQREDFGSFRPAGDLTLLSRPTADAESLLGREVVRGDDGGWQIADAIKPGCLVKVERFESAYEQRYEVDAAELGFLAGGYRELAEIQAKYGKELAARYAVHNTEELKAELVGDCGEVVINAVMIGHGERALVRKASHDVGGRAKIKGAPIAAGQQASAGESGLVKWDRPQAYAYHLREHQEDELVRLDPLLESSVRDGEALHLVLSSTKSVDVVVAYLEADGCGDVVWPSPQFPSTQVPAGGRLEFPPLTASLRDPKHGATERLVVWAFTDPKEFQLLRPMAGAWRGCRKDAMAEFEQAVGGRPRERWTRMELTYEILPKP